MIKAYQKYSIEITQDYEELLYDEYPYLFIGKNELEQVIIGSFIYDDEEEEKEVYFYLLVEKTLLVDYFQKKVSYYKLLKKANAIYIVSKNYNRKMINVEKTNFEDIKKEILPSKNSFYRLDTIPKVIKDLEYSKKETKIIYTTLIPDNSYKIKVKGITLTIKKYVQTDLQLF